MLDEAPEIGLGPSATFDVPLAAMTVAVIHRFSMNVESYRQRSAYDAATSLSDIKADSSSDTEKPQDEKTATPTSDIERWSNRLWSATPHTSPSTPAVSRNPTSDVALQFIGARLSPGIFADVVANLRTHGR